MAMHVLAEGGQQIEVFGGGHSIEVVTGSLKLAAGELGAYQPDWARLSATCSSAPSGYGLPPHFIEVTGALHRLSAAAQETAAKMRLAHNRIEHLEEDLVRAADQYEQAESENLGTIGFAGEDATWGTVQNMMEASPDAKYAIGAAAGLTYVPGFFGLLMQNRLNPEGFKELGAKNVKGLFSFAFPAAPRIEMDAKDRRSVQRADASKLRTWIEQQQLAGEGRGSIVVSKVVTESGEHAWIVTLPGTNMSKDSPWGLPRMKQAFNRETDDVRKAVEAALKDVGAKPGEGVYLNGHSQGGRHALNLSEDQQFKAKYTLKGAFTAGAPHGDEDPPADVPQLMLIDPDDAIPALGAAGALKVSPNRVALFSKSGHRYETDSPSLLGSDHGSQNYLNHAKAADGVEDTALRDLKRRMQIEDLKITETYRFTTSTGSGD